MTLYKIVGLRTGGRRAKCLKNRVKSSKIELRFREVRSEGCTSCTSVLQALIYFRCIFTALLRQSRFLFVALLRTKKNTPAPLGRGCSAVIGNVRWKRKASFAAGSWPGSRSPGPMRHCGRRSARCAQRAARRIPGG